jgi:hypothetical protein
LVHSLFNFRLEPALALYAIGLLEKAVNLATLEKKAEAALLYLHEGAIEHAQARAEADYMDSWCKTELARIKGLFVGMSGTAATDEALRHPDYIAALQAAKTANEVWYTAQFKRGAVIEAWRTACSNARANV